MITENPIVETFNGAWAIITAVFSAVAAAGTWFIKNWTDGKAAQHKLEAELQKRETAWLNQVEKDRDRYKTEAEDEKARIEELQRRILQLEFSSQTDLSPKDIVRKMIGKDIGVSFVKERISEGYWRMVEVSPLYALTYLAGPPEIYRGKTDKEIWGKEIGTMFALEDDQCFRTQEGMSVENQEISSPLSGAVGTYTGRKYCVRLGDTDFLISFGEHTESEKTNAHPI